MLWRLELCLCGLVLISGLAVIIPIPYHVLHLLLGVEGCAFAGFWSNRGGLCTLRFSGWVWWFPASTAQLVLNSSKKGSYLKVTIILLRGVVEGGVIYVTPIPIPV
ncbi:hypothetical protein LIER_21412 [Lithospermum erythrorhizon]|uniref:Uncharacterized protein n=1 Tax=Lithospermum erythrorhizon TaxID=34254 RepID=A0AAV3QTB6_LITER